MKGFFWEGDIQANAIGHIFKEIYYDGIYYPYFQGKKDLTVIDCGSNLGFFSLFASPYASKIFSIEPSLEHLDVQKYMLKFNEITNVKTFQFALSIKDDEGVLTHYTNKTMYSLYENLAVSGQGGLAATGSEPVKMKRINTFFKEEEIEHVDFMKLDCEGVEFEILGSDAFGEVAPKIDKILVEVHSYSGRNPQQIIESLKNNGYQVKRIPNDVNLLIAER